MNAFSEIVAEHFGFLETRYGFTCVIVSPTKVRYTSDRVFFEITSNPRDGIDVVFGRLGQAGKSTVTERLSLGVFLGAIRTQLGNYREESFADLSSPEYSERKIADLSAGLAEFGRGIITGEVTIYEKAGGLQFWHVGDWTNRWGTSIAMSTEEINRQRRLLADLLSLAQNS